MPTLAQWQLGRGGRCLLLLGVVAAVAVPRAALFNQPHSGQARPPMFGDFEAQRHWLELTWHLPPHEWYRNSTRNDLQYWGLDYPPLTAYHSWLMAGLAHRLGGDPVWLALGTSRGCEAPGLKLFMRWQALLTDLVCHVSAWLCFLQLQAQHRRLATSFAVSCALAVLSAPAQILVDHGHFQFNSASLGLAIGAVTAFLRRRDLLGAFLFCGALNYKQMTLYYALPVFVLLLSRCRHAYAASGWRTSLVQLLSLGGVVLLSFALFWAPFLHRVELVSALLHRLFPFARGLFEDKVSNVWCLVSVLVKLKQRLSIAQAVRMCTCSTLLLSLPNLVLLFRRPTEERFLRSLAATSLTFFLFSFQVHEKSVLLPCTAVLLLFPVEPLLCTWFGLCATLSMWPLLLKDGLAWVTLPLCVIFAVLGLHSARSLQQAASAAAPAPRGSSVSKRLRLAVAISMTGYLLLLAASRCAGLAPPARFPDLYALLISAYSCLHFLGFWLYFNVSMLRPTECVVSTKQE